MKRKQAVPAVNIEAAAMTVREFCASHRVSRSHFYNLIRKVSGPRLMKVGGRTLVSVESAADWLARMEGRA